jgi:hypothetical protein
VKTLEKLVASVAVAGLLLGGAGPALADGGRDYKKKDDTIKVILVEKHAKSGKKKTVEEKRVNLKEAARYADRKCDRGNYWDFYKKAKWVEEKDKEWVKVCSYDHRHNKNKDYYVYFSDVDKKHHDGWDGKKDDKKDDKDWKKKD